MRRLSARRAVPIALAVLAFLAVSAMLARWLSTENAERNAVVELIDAQARGDEPAMLRALSGCDTRPACRVRVRELADRLRRPEGVKVLAFDSSTAHSLAGETGPTRVAWKANGRLPVVQCVLVRRKGNPVTGTSVNLLELSAPIPRTARCR